MTLGLEKTKPALTCVCGAYRPDHHIHGAAGLRRPGKLDDLDLAVRIVAFTIKSDDVLLPKCASENTLDLLRCRRVGDFNTNAVDVELQERGILERRELW